MGKIAIIDYGAGNLGSVFNALKRLGYNPLITGSISDITDADALILPGVGAAGDTMKRLELSGLAEAIRISVSLNKPLFAICVGMQVLLSSTEEGGKYACLDIIPGTVKRLPVNLKVPHMGWNQVKRLKTHPIFTNIPDKANFYFVHSYYADPLDNSVIAGETEYGIKFCSMLIKGNLIATQFHPEKSGEIGLQMYSNFLMMALS
jgi:glutamine amidotransferase